MLVIVGEQDFIPPAITREIAQALPDATLVAFPSCGLRVRQMRVCGAKRVEQFLRGDAAVAER
jgi:hypothetical protein